jgi:hypothetical protein
MGVLCFYPSVSFFACALALPTRPMMVEVTLFRKNITGCLPSLPMIAQLIEFQAMALVTE